MSQKGLAPILIVLILAALIGGYLVYQQSISKPIPSPQPTTQLSPSPTDSTANWKTYTNTKYGFEFKYPDGWSVESIPSITSPNKSVSTSDFLRFYDVTKELEDKKFGEECTKNPNLPKCGTERYTRGVFLNIYKNNQNLDSEAYFESELAPKFAVVGDSKRIVNESKKEQIGSLTVIKGNKLDITGWPFYYFSNPSGTIAIVFSGGESGKSFSQILSTFKFIE